MAIGAADIFTADYSTRAGNWTAISADDAYVTTTRIATGGPNGLDALQIAFTAGAGISQPYVGGTKSGLSNPVDGTARYYRYFEWHHASNTYALADGGAAWVFKRLIIDDGGADRVIINTHTEAGASRIDAIFDGSSVSSTGNMAIGQWHAIQIEVIYQTSPTASTIKVWLDNDTYASPNAIVTMVADTPNPGIIGYGRYSNDTLASGGQYIMREAAFRAATTFDSSWYNWLQNGDGGGSIPSIGPAFLL